MTKQAKFIKTLDNFAPAEQKLWRVSPPMKRYVVDDTTEELVEEDVTFVMSSAVNNPYSGKETFLFPATEEGEVIELIEMTGSSKGTMDHTEPFRWLGYEVIDYPLAPKKKPITLGSISGDTLRVADLYVAFHTAVEEIDKAKLREALDGVSSVAEAVDRLYEALVELAPPLTHFGAHDGDGACFGFWIDLKAYSEARHSEVIVEKHDYFPDARPSHTQYIIDFGQGIEAETVLYDLEGNPLWRLAGLNEVKPED